ITQVYKDANNYSQYRYDGFGQLKRENYKWGGTAYTKLFNYDVGGNITSKVRYAFVDGDGAVGTAQETVSYAYADTAWKDKLTSYNGAAITYDEIGNPLTDGTLTYTWAQGRKLQQIAKTGTTASYKYNDSGIRSEKTVNGVTTVYNVVGGQVTWEKTGSSTPIYYTYDASGSLWGMQYNGSMYFYVRNAQGDIIRLINSSGTVVVEYAYDAWGKLLSTTGSLASTLGVGNPYRYRGYRFDTETGLYYLQSRYYNPHWGRFVNADGLVNGSSFVSANLFAYAENNPITFSDPTGNIAIVDDLIIGITFFVILIVAAEAAIMTNNSALPKISMPNVGSLERTYSTPWKFELPKEEAKAEEKTRDVALPETQKYNYYEVSKVKNTVITGRGISFRAASLRVASGLDVMCSNQESAKAIIFMNRYINSVGPEIHGGDGYYWHYHPNRNNHTHIWFFSP
ncbi:MAG: RHS repeat-associated core domain-containing protein, partial [Bacillota bacterium]|nr:RHS repeat-associated core domain-containing protein [Bacillota bacterium]